MLELKSQGFKVAGIVSDSMRVQVSSIHEIIEESEFRFHVSCGNHCIHNAIKDAFETNETMAQMLRCIE